MRFINHSHREILGSVFNQDQVRFCIKNHDFAF